MRTCIDFQQTTKIGELQLLFNYLPNTFPRLWKLLRPPPYIPSGWESTPIVICENGIGKGTSKTLPAKPEALTILANTCALPSSAHIFTPWSKSMRSPAYI